MDNTETDGAVSSPMTPCYIQRHEERRRGATAEASPTQVAAGRLRPDGAPAAANAHTASPGRCPADRAAYFEFALGWRHSPPWGVQTGFLTVFGRLSSGAAHARRSDCSYCALGRDPTVSKQQASVERDAGGGYALQVLYPYGRCHIYTMGRRVRRRLVYFIDNKIYYTASE